jgi:hypothetical protein
VRGGTEGAITGKSARSGVFFLNSEVKYQDPKNFTIFINKAGAEKFKKAKVDDPAAHFKGKMVRVTGTVKLYKERPEIVVEDPDQVEIVEKKNPLTAAFRGTDWLAIPRRARGRESGWGVKGMTAGRLLRPHRPVPLHTWALYGFVDGPEAYHRLRE